MLFITATDLISVPFLVLGSCCLTVNDIKIWWLNGKESPCQCRSNFLGLINGFDPWVGKILWRKTWQPTPVIFAWRIPWTEEPGGLQYRVTKSQTRLKLHSTHCGLPVMKLQPQTYWNLVIILKVTVIKSLKSKILESKYYMIIQIWVFSFLRLKSNSIGEKCWCAWLWGWVVVVSQPSAVVVITRLSPSNSMLLPCQSLSPSLQ